LFIVISRGFGEVAAHPVLGVLAWLAVRALSFPWSDDLQPTILAGALEPDVPESIV
jgi:hypothetical protein